MFTPQKKVWLDWPLSARKRGAGSGPGSGGLSANPSDGKGKSVAPAEPATPPLGPNGMAVDGDDLAEKVSQLEKELFEYQYNMGLVLIEKKEWTAEYERLKEVLAETKDALKREQTAHLIAMSEVEKREDDLRKALGVEKQCVSDLEKALREMRSEYAEIKFTADSKLAEANAIVASIDEKSLEFEAKMHSAEAKLAEISRKSSEIERKQQDLEAREADLQKKRLSFITEREAHESNFSKQREDLLEWERKLRESEERIGDRQRILNQREERANEKDKIYKQKEKDLEDVQKMIDEATSTLKQKEDDISSRVSKLAIREKEYEALQKNLEMKEKELLVLEETLKEREQVEIQKLLDEHNEILDAKKREFELEIEQKRKSVDEELGNKGFELQKKEAEINHKEEKLAKKEQALEKKSEKLKEKEEDFQSKLKDLKERERLLRSEEKNLEAEKKQLLVEKEELVNLKTRLEKIRADNEEQLLKIRKEKDQLKVTEEERSEYVRLQWELRQEIEKCRVQKEMLLKEAEDLKQQKEMFEKEWEVLDEKKAEVEKGLKDLSQEKEKFQKLKEAEEERLQKKLLETEEEIKRELENLNLAKETSAARLEHEKSVLTEQIQSERSQMLRDFELKKKELESDMQKKLEEQENDLCYRKKLFEEEKERELGNISYLRELARREMEEMKQERLVMGKEREEFSANKKHLEEEQTEIRRDIDKLMVLSQKMKEQREKFNKERQRFISFVEKQSSCSNCGECTREFVVSDMQCLSEIENLDIPQSKFAVVYHKEGFSKDQEAIEGQKSDASPHQVGSRTPVSAGTMSWLRKCTSKIFNFSPGKKDEFHPVQNLTLEGTVPVDQASAEEQSKVSGENDIEVSLAAVSASEDVQRLPSGQEILVDEQSNVNIAEDSHPSDLRSGKHEVRKRGRARVDRTRTMKQVVKDAEAILGEGLETNERRRQNGNAEESAHTNLDSREESSLAERGKRGNGRKRTRASHHDGDETEGHSDSVTGNQQRKRRQKPAAAGQPPVEPRYNLRRPKGRGTGAATSRASSDLNERKKNDAQGDGLLEVVNSKAAPAHSVTVASENGGSTHFVRCGTAANMEDTTKELAPNNPALSEEVNGTPDRVREGSDYNALESGDSDEEREHPGEVSMGKKLWTFFTT
ncbi:protein CROWDED NUCLEI 1 [Punica granatum]|uniref:Protein CROWDED NUCLEI 1 n=1 Tax=Punica granatum TaxID=22663 RepID=A0A6P8D7A1_PUNGR|nr:protein CROWDED NUCLEI 1 [Punica granatum]